MAPGRRQAIIWTDAEILLIRTLTTNFCGTCSEIRTSIENVCEMAVILSHPQFAMFTS